MREFEFKVYSQNGEDGIIEHIFATIGIRTRYFVELGVHPTEGNTIYLQEQGWDGLWIDANGEGEIKRERITAENIGDLLRKYKVPEEFDLLSIDIDGNDYYVWEAIKQKPRVVVIEYNANIPANESKTIHYDPDHTFQNNDYFGASLLALDKLAKRKGYTLVYCESKGANAFFVRNDLAREFKKSTVAELWKPPGYGGWRSSGKPMREV